MGQGFLRVRLRGQRGRQESALNNVFAFVVTEGRESKLNVFAFVVGEGRVNVFAFVVNEDWGSKLNVFVFVVGEGW